MVSIILASHGNFAAGLLKSAEMIIGKQDHIQVIRFLLGENVDLLQKKIKRAVKKATLYGEVIVLTDMKSGSPFNMAVSIMSEFQYHHITGMNLPMLLEILGRRSVESADEICSNIVELSKETIIHVNQLLKEV